MTVSRIALARDQGLFQPAESGRALWINGTTQGADDVFDGLDLTVMQPLQPEFDRLRDTGKTVVPDLPAPDAGPFDLVVVDIPRARALAKHWIAAAGALLSQDGILVIQGAKTDGIDGLFKALRAGLAKGGSYTKAHGRAFWGQLTEAFPAPGAAVTPMADGFVTGLGVFSAAHVDPGSAALAQALPGNLKGRVGDLGAGWGYLSAQVLKLPRVERIDLVEADHEAVLAAKANISDPRAQFHWADATTWRPDASLDAIVMNPPFHTGRKGTPELGQAFLRQAAACLGTSGQLWMVANRHLPYESVLTETFRTVREVAGTGAFKVLCATHPNKPKRRG